MSALLLIAALSMPEAHAARITTDVVGIDDLSIGLGGVRFTVRAHVTREGLLPMRLNGVRYQIRLQDTVVGEGFTDTPVRLKNNRPAEVLIPTTVSAGRSLGVLLSQDPASMALTISGDVVGRVLWIKRSRPFNSQIALADFLSAVEGPSRSDLAVFEQPQPLVGVEGAVVADGAAAGEVDLDGGDGREVAQADVGGEAVLAALP